MTIGIVVALVIGKPLGIVAACLLAVKLRLSALPDGVDWRGLVVIGCFAGTDPPRLGRTEFKVC